MGEIAEALRRANEERDQDRREEAESAPNTHEERPSSADSVYAESQERYRRLESEKPSVGSKSLAASEVPTSALQELTHARRESLPPQGVVVDDGGAVTEACFQLALRVRSALEERSARSLLVASALRNEGKTTVACNLSLSLATLSRGRRVALVDLDLRKPAVATALELEAVETGVEAVIDGKVAPERVRLSISRPKLDVYPALKPQSHAHELLILPGLAALVEELERCYDVVVFDTPPSLLVPDATLVLGHVAAFVAVARAGVTRARPFRRMLATLPGRQLMGAILNDTSPMASAGDYRYYRYEPEDAVR